MNYLAHLVLAGADEDARLGNLLGDFVKGPVESHGDRYGPAVLDGIRCHRVIDRFTDSHPVFRRSCSRLGPKFRRVSAIAMDLAYDHLLVSHWSMFCLQPFPEFVASTYELLERRSQELPPRLQQALPMMVEQDWLGSYASWAGVEIALARVSRRMKRSDLLARVWPVIVVCQGELAVDFLEFFPEAIAFVDQWQRDRVGDEN